MSKVRPSSTVEGVSNELTKADKMEVIDMAALAKLCYFREDCLIELDKRRKDHEGCTPFNCIVLNKMLKPLDKGGEGMEDDPDINSYQCFGICSKVSNLHIISDPEKKIDEKTNKKIEGSGADCLVGNYKNDVFVAFRGTEGPNFKDWKTNLTANPEVYEKIKEDGKKILIFPKEIEIHKGFRTQFDSIYDQQVTSHEKLTNKGYYKDMVDGRGKGCCGGNKKSNKGTKAEYANVVNEAPNNNIHSFLKANVGGDKSKTIYVTGHSLGGGISNIACLRIAKDFPDNKVIVCTFGGPRSGNDKLVEAINDKKNIVASYRFQAHFDPIPYSNSVFFGGKLAGNWVQHIRGGGKRDADGNLPEGEFTIRWKKVMRTNNSKTMVIWHFFKIVLWTLFDAGSAFGFHDQNLYHDKLIHEWIKKDDTSVLSDPKQYKNWKRKEIYDDPLMVQIYLFLTSFSNVSIAFLALQAGVIVTWDFLWLNAKDDSAWGLCVEWGLPIPAKGGFGYDEELHRQFYKGNDTDTIWSYNSDSTLQEQYSQTLDFSNPRVCDPTPGYVKNADTQLGYTGDGTDYSNEFNYCREGYTCGTDIDQVGYTWAKGNGYEKMPYCMRLNENNVTTCGDLKYCAAWEELNGYPAHADNIPANSSPNSWLLIVMIFLLYVAFTLTISNVFGNLMKCCPPCQPKYKRSGPCGCKKKLLSKREKKEELGKGFTKLRIMDAIVKFALYYIIISSDALNYFTTLLNNKCVSGEAHTIYISMQKAVTDIYLSVTLFMYFKLVAIGLKIVKLYGDPPNDPTKAKCRIC